jgi:hypothetical protein
MKTHMKKKIALIAALFLAITSTTQAQNFAYQQGDNLLNIGTSFGYYDFGFGATWGRRYMLVPPITVAYEKGVHEYFSFGLFAGYSAWNYRNAGENYLLQYFGGGARGSFHFWGLLMDFLDADIENEKLDVYFLGSLGLVFESRTFPNNSGVRLNGSPLLINLGIRYYVKPNLALFIEGGQGFNGFGVFGVTFKR